MMFEKRTLWLAWILSILSGWTLGSAFIVGSLLTNPANGNLLKNPSKGNFLTR
jgi:hypothetical protein